MIKNIFTIIVLVTLLLLPCFSYAADPPDPEATGTPLVYKVTLERFRISTDTGATWTTVREADIEFDIASSSAGAAVGNFFAGSFQPGTYDTIEHTSSSTFNMQGYIIDAVGTDDYYTSTTGANGTASTTSFDVNSPPSDYGEASIIIYSYNAGDSLPAVEETVSIAIIKGATQKINIDFDVTNTLALYDVGGGSYQLMPAPPTVTITTE
ncbi:MAG: hypothetical protein P9L93_02855 [Candidatus Gorgyraea atricola]|nr:hypothetical protein [Candidatus Gorgyraea atricola]